MRSEDLLGFVRQKENKVVHGVNLFVVVSVLAAKLGYELLTKQVDRRGESLSEIFVLECVQHGALDLVYQGTRHGYYQSVFNL